MNNNKGFLSLFSAGVIFGSFGIWIRLLNEELSTYQQIALRNLIGFVFAVLITFILKQKWNFKKVNKLYLFLYAVLFPVAIIFFVYAMIGTKISTAIFAFYASSFIVSLILGTVVFKDKLTKNNYISLLIAFFGLLILTFPFSIITLNIGFVFGLLSGMFDSITNGFRRNLGGKVDNFVLVSIQMFSGLVIATLLAIFAHQSIPTNVSVQIYIIGVIFGFLLMLVAYLTLVGFQNVKLNVGTIIISSEIFFAILFAAIIFNEIPTKNEIVGGLFIIASILISNIPDIDSIFSSIKLKIKK